MIPEELEREGLGSALGKLARKLTQSGKIVFSYQHIGLPLAADALKSFELYNVTLELCNNILKHSSANVAVIEIEQEDSALYLRVWDNGAGFNVEKTEKGNGLVNIENRIASINGRLKVTCGHDLGTRLVAEISLF